MLRKTTVAMMGLALCACEEKPAEGPKTEVAAKPATETAKPSTETTGETTEKKPAIVAGTKAWQIELEGSGLPEVTGPSVTVSQIPTGGVIIQLVGFSDPAHIILKGVDEAEIGTHTPDEFTVVYRKKKVRCGTKVVGQGEREEVTLTLEERPGGIKGTIEGEVTCGNIDGSGTPTNVKVRGWFEG